LADYVTLLLQFYWKQFQSMKHPDSCLHIMAFLRVGMRYNELSVMIRQQEINDYDDEASDGGDDDEDQGRSTRIYRIALVEAARSGHIGFLQALLDAGADPNEADYLGSTALHAASITKHLQACQILLEKGAVVDYVDNSGWTPFQNLLRCDDAISGHNVDVLLQICDALLAAGADFWKSIEDDDDKALARAACVNDGIQCRIMERFLAAWDQRYPTGQDRTGRFPLHVAIVAKAHEKHINLDVVRLLLRHSPRSLELPVKAANGEPWLPLHWACMNDKRLDVVYTLLREYPGAVNTRTTTI
jgi:ankyrin repeat protein